MDARGALLEVSTVGKVSRPIPPVTGLGVLHQSGQTFVTWKEIEVPVGRDAPTFADFENAVLAEPLDFRDLDFVLKFKNYFSRGTNIRIGLSGFFLVLCKPRRNGKKEEAE